MILLRPSTGVSPRGQVSVNDERQRRQPGVFAVCRRAAGQLRGSVENFSELNRIARCLDSGRTEIRGTVQLSLVTERTPSSGGQAYSLDCDPLLRPSCRRATSSQ